MNERLKEVIGLFTRLGFTAFGGPAAHIAMMRTEVVEKRQWLDEGEFVDLMSSTNLIPGPNSTELAIHLGYRRAGVAGLVAAGVCFIVPAMLIVTVLAWAYVRYGSLPAMTGLLYGMKPVVVAIVLQALVGLAKSTLNSQSTIFTGLLSLGLSLSGYVGELWLVFVPGLIFAALAARNEPEKAGIRRLVVTIAAVGALLVISFGVASFALTKAPISMESIFLSFLKVGSVLYGSGYVLLSYLNTDLVARLGWLTKGQLLDAVSVGQFTPGPVFTTATFIGYLLAGFPGALVATLGIFLPSFIFVAASARWLGDLRKSATTKAFLSGVNASSIGLMGAVLIKLGQAAVIDIWTGLIGLASFSILLRWKPNSVWLVLGGAFIGFLLKRG